MPINHDSTAVAVWVVSILVYTLVAIAMGFVARSKGYTMAVGIALSLVTTFLGALLILWILPTKNASAAPDVTPREDPKFRLLVEMEKARLHANRNSGASE